MEEILGSIYCNNSDKFGTRLMKNAFRTIKAEKNDLVVVFMEVKIIGQMDNTLDHTFESANRIYDKNGLSPTINTCDGDGLQPKVIDKPKQLGFMDNGTGKHQSNTVYDEKGICPNITTIEGGGTQQIKIATADVIRMVRTEEGKKFRKQYENHEIQHGFNEFREPALRKDGCSNTLTSVQKDNMVCVAMRGRNPENPLDRTSGIHTEQRLEVNKNGTINTLTSVQKDNLVMETVKIKQATKEGYIECEVGGVADLSYPNSKTRRGRVQDSGNVRPTLTAQNQDICKIGQISSDKSQYGTVISDDGLSSTLQAGTHGYANNCIATQYRIRKLTPRECWRLMDFKDSDFEKAQEVNSNTQLYKQAGNSIVKNVLVAIFGQMIDGKENVYKEVV